MPEKLESGARACTAQSVNEFRGKHHRRAENDANLINWCHGVSMICLPEKGFLLTIHYSREKNNAGYTLNCSPTKNR